MHICILDLSLCTIPINSKKLYALYTLVRKNEVVSTAILTKNIIHLILIFYSPSFNTPERNHDDLNVFGMTGTVSEFVENIRVGTRYFMVNVSRAGKYLTLRYLF